MSKLTKAQIAVLERMNSGDEVWTVSGRDPSAFWLQKIMDRAPSFATLNALERAAVIENYDSDFKGRKYRITDLGRAALANGDEGK